MRAFWALVLGAVVGLGAQLAWATVVIAAGTSASVNGNLFMGTSAVASSTNGQAGGYITGYFPGLASTHALEAVEQVRLQHPIVANLGATGGRIGITTNTTGSVGGTFDLVLFDVTATATLCSKTAISCTAAVGTTSASCSGGIAAAAAGDDVELRVDTTNCTGTNPIGNAFVAW